MKLLPHSSATLLIRTDFADQSSWDALHLAVSTPNKNDFLANVEFFEDGEFNGLVKDQILARVPAHHNHRLLIIADKDTLSSAELPLLVIDLVEEGPNEIRVIATELWGIENNLSLANMDFYEFAHAVDEDGV